MKKFFIAIISIVILAIIAYGIAYFVLPVSSMELTRYTHSVGFVCDNSYIVRDETVYYSDSDGVVYNIVGEGDRVSLGATVSNVYKGDVKTDTLKQLRTIDSKINKLEGDGHNSELYKSDSDSSEVQIADNMEQVLELAQDNDVSKINNIKNDINDIRNGKSVSESAKIDALLAERAKIESSISAKKSQIKADRSGIFTSYVDGLENVLTPEKVQELSPTALMALEPKTSEYLNGKKTTSGKPVGKVMNNHVWYISGVADSAQAKMLEETPHVTIRFSNIAGADVEGDVSYISSPDADGKCVFMIKLGTYVETAFAGRKVSAQIIFTEYTGYKVPTSAIRNGKTMNTYYVWARKGSEAYKCDVEVLYSDTAQSFSIIRSTEDAENKLGSMERLVVGER